MSGGAAYAFEKEVGPGSKYRMPTHDFAASTELRFLLDRCFAAHQANRPELAGAFARAAEAILRSALPEIADDIAQAASRKGRGDAIGARLAQHLDALSAGCVALVLLLRGARRPAIDTLTNAFRNDAEFEATVKALCPRAIPAARLAHAVPLPQIEVAAPYRR